MAEFTCPASTEISIYHLEVGTVFHSTDDDIKADTLLDLHKVGQLVRVGWNLGLLVLTLQDKPALRLVQGRGW